MSPFDGRWSPRCLWPLKSEDKWDGAKIGEGQGMVDFVVVVGTCEGCKPKENGWSKES